MAGILQAKKGGDPLDVEGFWLFDKFQVTADFLISSYLQFFGVF
jgi:hypothetical protein